MKTFQFVGTVSFRPALLLVLSISILAAICGCRDDQQAAPTGGPTVVSSADSSRIALPETRDDAPDEPKEELTGSQAPPPAGVASEDDETIRSGDEGLPGELQKEPGNARGSPGAEAPDSMPDDSDLSPVDALKALGATIKLNVSGDVVNVDLKGTEAGDATLSRLEEMTEIRKLNLSLTAITDEGLPNLKGLTKLTHLYLFGTNTTDAGLEHLSGLVGLELLCLDDTTITDAGLEHLKNMTELETLHIQSKKTITDAGLEKLTGLTKLAELRVGGTEVTDEGVDELKQSLPDCRVVR